MTTILDELLSDFMLYLSGVEDARLAPFLAEIDAKLAARLLSPRLLACVQHLDRLARSAPPETRSLVETLARSRDLAHWGQTYTQADFGQNFIDNYGWVEVFGTRGHFVCDRVAAGFLILGPNIDYPDHHHVAEEIYIPLSGTALWLKGEGGFLPRLPGEVIRHPSNINHAMRTGDDPLLALYLWRGGPLAARSTIAGQQAG